jgi:toxin ParE1/3/4
MRILWSPQSLGDLHAIHEYIAKDSEHYAGLTIARIFSAVERLIEFPRSGRIVPERGEPEIREVIVGRFRVVEIRGEIGGKFGDRRDVHRFRWE